MGTTSPSRSPTRAAASAGAWRTTCSSTCTPPPPGSSCPAGTWEEPPASAPPCMGWVMVCLCLGFIQDISEAISRSPVDGYGTDAYIYLKALETDARETLPIFNASSSSKIRDTKNQVEDWTKDE